MKRKKVGIFVSIFLIFNILPITGALNETNMNLTEEIELIPVLEFKDNSTTNGLLGFSVELMNSGVGMTGNIDWSMNVSGGVYDIPFIKKKFVPETLTYGTIESLGANESETIDIGPRFFAFGRFTISFECTYTLYTVTKPSKCDLCECDISVIQEYTDQGVFGIYHTFPPNQQPITEWINITNYKYLAGGLVEFNNVGPPRVPPPGITQKHNVRVYDPVSHTTLFLGASKFTDGTSMIKECYLTYDSVVNNGANWQVELVNGA